MLCFLFVQSFYLCVDYHLLSASQWIYGFSSSLISFRDFSPLFSPDFHRSSFLSSADCFPFFPPLIPLSSPWILTHPLSSLDSFPSFYPPHYSFLSSPVSFPFLSFPFLSFPLLSGMEKSSKSLTSCPKSKKATSKTSARDDLWEMNFRKKTFSLFSGALGS